MHGLTIRNGSDRGLIRPCIAKVPYLCRTYFVHVSYMFRSYKGTRHVGNKMETLIKKYRNIR